MAGKTALKVQFERYRLYNNVFFHKSPFAYILHRGVTFTSDFSVVFSTARGFSGSAPGRGDRWRSSTNVSCILYRWWFRKKSDNIFCMHQWCGWKGSRLNILPSDVPVRTFYETIIFCCVKFHGTRFKSQDGLFKNNFRHFRSLLPAVLVEG